MRKLAALAVATTAALVGVLMAISFLRDGSGPTAGAALIGDQADSAQFRLLEVDNVYCGVQTRAEPYILDVAVSSPPQLSDPENPESPPLPGHDRAAWLSVEFQTFPVGSQYNVPFNSSFSFSLTLGGVPGKDQLVRIESPPKGDPSGAGAHFEGYATVRAQEGARDPFRGDNRNDNFCVVIGPGGEQSGGEFDEGDISTNLPVPDEWVVDGDGSDGGVLVGTCPFSETC